jgi:hypothetical protein
VGVLNASAVATGNPATINTSGFAWTPGNRVLVFGLHRSGFTGSQINTAGAWALATEEHSYTDDSDARRGISVYELIVPGSYSPASVQLEMTGAASSSVAALAVEIEEGTDYAIVASPTATDSGDGAGVAGLAQDPISAGSGDLVIISAFASPVHRHKKKAGGSFRPRPRRLWSARCGPVDAITASRL